MVLSGPSQSNKLSTTLRCWHKFLGNITRCFVVVVVYPSDFSSSFHEELKTLLKMNWLRHHRGGCLSSQDRAFIHLCSPAETTSWSKAAANTKQPHVSSSQRKTHRGEPSQNFQTLNPKCQTLNPKWFFEKHLVVGHFFTERTSTAKFSNPKP